VRQSAIVGFIGPRWVALFNDLFNDRHR